MAYMYILYPTSNSQKDQKAREELGCLVNRRAHAPTIRSRGCRGSHQVEYLLNVGAVVVFVLITTSRCCAPCRLEFVRSPCRKRSILSKVVVAEDVFFF